MQLFVVFKQGVGRHECGGVFDTLDAAREAGRKLIAGEPDNYHTYEVVPFVLNEVTPQDPLAPDENGKTRWVDGGDLREATPLCVFFRGPNPMTGAPEIVERTA